LKKTAPYLSLSSGRQVRKKGGKENDNLLLRVHVEGGTAKKNCNKKKGTGRKKKEKEISLQLEIND